MKTKTRYSRIITGCSMTEGLMLLPADLPKKEDAAIFLPGSIPLDFPTKKQMGRPMEK